VVVVVVVAVAVAVAVAKLEKTRIPPSSPLQLLLPSSLLLLPPWFWRVPPPPSNVTAENSGFLPDFETTGMIKNSLTFRKCPAMKRKRTFLWSGLVHAIAHCRQLLTLPNPIPLPQAVEQDGPLLLTCISSPP
jgi:hypothetical protein